jgi:hypothetical protein
VTTSDVERHRHACEVRTVAGWRDTAEQTGDERRAEFLALVEKKRGVEAAQRLRRDVWNLIKGE